MHDILPSRIPGIRISAILDRLPGPNQPRFCQPLHAYVRNVGNGRKRSEPQKGGREQELDSEAVLLQQCTKNIISLRMWTSTDTITESSLHILRNERTLLHCPLPSLFLLSSALSNPPTTRKFTINITTRITSSTKAIGAFHKPVVRRGYGDGPVSLAFLFAYFFIGEDY